MKPNKYKINTQTNRITQYIYNNIYLIYYLTAISTIGWGILHLLMLKPSLKPANFPIQLSPYTDVLFTIAGILQIFWYIPMITRRGVKWNYMGLVGTIGLSKLLLMTRTTNGITNLPLENKNPTRLLTPIIQFLCIGSTIIIIKHLHNPCKFSKIEMH
jgi:hypothetical protein